MKIDNIVNDKNARTIIAMFFCTSKIDDFCYGDVVFEKFIENKEILDNAYKTVFSLGDIIDRNIYQDDLNPFLIRDDFCTVDKDVIYNGNIYVYMIEDIELQIVRKIDKRLKTSFSAYIGMSNIDIDSTDKRKQFWKKLIRMFSIEENILTAFGTEDEIEFSYKQIALNKGFKVKYDGFSYDCDFNKFGELLSTRKSSFLHSESQFKFFDGNSDSDRGLLEMNFSLVKEVEIAGVQIWKSIEDINRVFISKDKDRNPITDYIFLSLYQASQGIERLLKVIIELDNYKNAKNEEKDKINDLLYSHNHLAMYDYLANKYPISINTNCKKLLNILYQFYSNARYNRYKFSECDILELELILSFGSKIKEDNFNEELKNLYGKSLGKISQTLYELIRKLSHELSIYTYEINYDSVANFALSNYYEENLYKTLKQIERSKKELILYILNDKNSLPLSNLLNEIKPLDFEKCNVNEYIVDLISNENGSKLLHNFVSYEYEELISENKPEWKERIDMVDGIIGNTNIFFEDDLI